MVCVGCWWSLGVVSCMAVFVDVCSLFVVCGLLFDGSMFVVSCCFVKCSLSVVRCLLQLFFCLLLYVVRRCVFLFCLLLVVRYSLFR